MTLQEFKAWFDGFTENVTDKGPTIKQWKRVKERVAEIDGTTISYPVYIDRWVQPYRPYWSYTNTLSGVGTCGGLGLATQLSQNSMQAATADTVRLAFNSNEAMFAAGQAEAASIQ